MKKERGEKKGPRTNMVQIQVWSEGYSISGNEQGTAHLHGTVFANNLAHACHELSKKDAEFGRNFNPQTRMFWVCKLFDNARDARRSYG